MSERGSFTSEYLYCLDCAKALHRFFKEHAFKHLMSYVPYEEGSDILYKAVAGRIFDSCLGSEHLFFESKVVPLMSKVICHPVRFAVLAEQGHCEFYLVKPGAERPEPVMCSCWKCGGCSCTYCQKDGCREAPDA